MNSNMLNETQSAKVQIYAQTAVLGELVVGQLAVVSAPFVSVTPIGCSDLLLFAPLTCLASLGIAIMGWGLGNSVKQLRRLQRPIKPTP